MEYEWGLVLEGGGTRGVFTAGFVDALLDYGVVMPYVIGVSAGALTGCDYVARQRGRTRFIDIDLQRIRPYVGLRWMLSGRGIIDLDFLFRSAPEKYYPFDFASYSKSNSRVVIVSTDMLTGKAVYSEEKNDFERFIDAGRSSCSLPVLCPSWHLDGRPMVDGGVADSIPFERALEDGCKKLIVVLNKDAAYKKKEHPWLEKIRFFGKYGRLMHELASRNRRYNEQVENLRKLEREGRAIVVRPETMCGVGRTTTDTEKLEQLYAVGLKAGRDVALRLAK